MLEPYNRSRLIRFHALQSIFAGVSLYAGWIALRILSFPPFVLFAMMVYPLFCFGLWLLLMYRAYRGERWELPVVGTWASSLADK